MSEQKNNQPKAQGAQTQQRKQSSWQRKGQAIWWSAEANLPRKLLHPTRTKESNVQSLWWSKWSWWTQEGYLPGSHEAPSEEAVEYNYQMMNQGGYETIIAYKERFNVALKSYQDQGNKKLFPPDIMVDRTSSAVWTMRIAACKTDWINRLMYKAINLLKDLNKIYPSKSVADTKGGRQWIYQHLHNDAR